MTKKHTHQFGKVVAGYTEPGQDALTWQACRICGSEDPKHKRPAAALDSPPENEE